MVSLPDAYRVDMHATCAQNELVALRNRHLVGTGLTVNRKLFKQAATVLRHFKTHIYPVSYYELCQHYRGAKRQRYLNAADNLITNGWDPKYAYIQMFVKPDKMEYNQVRTKPPRAIQYRTAEYNLCVARWMKPIEEWFYEQVWGYTQTRFVAKGLNMQQRGKLLREKYLAYSDPVILCADHSRYDSTITREHLIEEFRFYLRLVKDSNLKYYLKYQFRNTGFSRHGIQYNVKGTRMSGDYNTALGGTIVNFIALTGWMAASSIDKYDLIVDGDDSVLFIERHNYDQLSRDWFSRIGFKTKIEVPREFRHIDFCKCRPVLTECGWVMTRDPMRVISHLQVSKRHYRGKAWRAWLRAVGNCEGSIGGNYRYRGPSMKH